MAHVPVKRRRALPPPRHIDARRQRNLRSPANPSNGIYPGGNVPVTSIITNSSFTQAQYVSNLHVAISIDATHAGNGCQASWFTYKADSQASGTDANPRTVALNTELAASANTTVDGHVFMADTASNQDACKGATITLGYTVNNS